MTGSRLGVGVVGCGLVGSRRAAVVADHPDSRLVAVADLEHGRAKAAAGLSGAAVSSEWEEVVERRDVEVVVVATTHEWLAPVAGAALRAGKHVLCEKPMSLNSRQAEELVALARASRGVLSVGFNHRHHPAIRQGHARAADGVVGDVLFIRCRYGHGGRPGYEREWRMDPAQSGGGELLDQGIHALDLFRWFLGDLQVVAGVAANWVWHASVEDNVFALLRSPRGQVASLHASWTQWKNLFSFEVFGERGGLVVEGLGGSYGTEALTIYRRDGRAGAPSEERLTFPGPDPSWQTEWAEFVAAIRTGARVPVSPEEGLAALKLVEAVYARASSTRDLSRPDRGGPTR